MKPRCVYCAPGIGTTDDHVPPRSFFPSPPPKDLITVPCCEDCRVRDQKDDRLLRNLFTSFEETEVHPAVTGHLAARRDKSFGDDRSIVPRLLEMMVQVTTQSHQGVVVRPAFNLKDPRVERFIERAGRAVLYHAHGESHFPAKFEWALNPPGVEEMLTMAPGEIARRDVGDIFTYLTAPLRGKEPRYVVMVFYRRFRAVAMFTPL